ncbi:uncharacterized protein LOC131944047 [Physella acuta]|uniref:uncharacterized protein LOC131944047 n=1 Tax=Physella acuta TaxID=109671 RepID=UPI0027DD278D|nr:uncharacterized protein LOC131944047 [Physella acuta]
MNITTDENISDFVVKIKSNKFDGSTASPNTSINSDNFVKQEEECPDTTQDSKKSSDESLFAELERFKKKESLKLQNSSGQFLAYPDYFGNTNTLLFARNLATPEGCKNLLKYGTFATFEELKKGVDQMVLQKNSLDINIYILSRKIIPKLYAKSCISSLVHISMCENVFLKSQAKSFAEILMLKEEFFNSPFDVQSLGTLLTMLLQTILRERYEQSQEAIKISRIQNHSIVVAMLLSRMAMACTNSDAAKLCQSFYNEASSILTSYRHFESTSPYQSMLEIFFMVPLQDLLQTLKDFSSWNLTTKQLPKKMSELLKKSEPHHFLVIMSCLNKIFINKVSECLELKFLQFYVTALQKRSKKYFDDNRPTSLCIDLIFRGLGHFLGFLVREHSHTDISVLYLEVVNIIKSMCDLYRLVKNEEDFSCLMPLIFDPAPRLRQIVTANFLFFGNNSEKILEQYVYQLNHILYPVLYIADKFKLLEKNMENGWRSISGKYYGYPALIYINILDKIAHGNFDKSKPIDSGALLNKNQIDKLRKLDHPNIITLLAWQIDVLPQFFILEDCRFNNLEKTTLQEYLVNKNKNSSYCRPFMLMSMLLNVGEALAYCHSTGIIHRNITAASVLLLKSEKVKLASFHLAHAIKQESVITTELKSYLPVRWTSPESHRRSKFSKASDVWMFGHLAYEILTHGALPYSNLKLDDTNCVLEICSFNIRLHHEPCFTDKQYKFISKCTAFDPNDRPTMYDVIEEIKKLIIEIKQQSLQRAFCYPNLQNGDRQPATNCKQVRQNNVLPCVRPLPLKYSRKMSEKLYLCRVGKAFVVRQTCYRKFSKEFLEQHRTGALDMIIPSLVIRQINPQRYMIDVNIAYNLKGNLLEILLNKEFGGSSEVCNNFLLKAAAMLEKLHAENFVLGDIRASQLFVELSDDSGTKIRPVSLAYLNYLGKNQCQIVTKIPSKTVCYRRAAPEWRDQGIQSKASDIYGFALMVLDAYFAITSVRGADKIEVFEKQRDMETHADVLENEIDTALENVPDGMPRNLFDLIKRALDVNPKLRPTLSDFMSSLVHTSSYEYSPSMLSTSKSDEGNSSEDHTENNISRFAMPEQFSRVNTIASTTRTIFEEDDDNWALLNSVNVDQTDPNSVTGAYNTIGSSSVIGSGDYNLPYDEMVAAQRGNPFVNATWHSHFEPINVRPNYEESVASSMFPDVE